MGRLPKNGIHKSSYLDANILKTRHRHADTKYRSNVQFLYSKLKEMSQNRASKDGLLSVSLLRIRSLENEIIEKVGSGEMKNYQDDFVNFLLQEEALWKIKDTFKWWRKVEEALNSHNFTSNKAYLTNSNRSKGSITMHKNLSSDAEITRSFNAKITTCVLPSETSDGFTAKFNKYKGEMLNFASDISRKNNDSYVSDFNENELVPSEDPDNLLFFEEENHFSNEISVEPKHWENCLF